MWLPGINLNKEKEYLIENLSMLLAAGMDILSAIEAIKVEIKSKRMRKIMESLKEDVESGSSLWQALEKSHLLPVHTIFLIRLGEETGQLPANLSIVATNQRKERDFHSKIRSAMIYPVIVFSLTLIISVGIAWFVLPRLAAVFTQLKIELPIVTKVMISIGSFLGAYGSIFIPGVILIIGLSIYFIFIFSKTKFIGQGVLFLIPGVSRLIQEIELACFGYVLGTLLKAGLLVTDALGSLQGATTIKAYQSFYSHLKNNIEEGNSFQKSISSYPKSGKLIPVPVQQMIITGEQSGRLSETLIKINETFEAKTDNTTKNLTIILEPVFLVIVWLGVISVALAVILPIYSLIGGLNK
jgi:type II secretory pathway component PulF